MPNPSFSDLIDLAWSQQAEARHAKLEAGNVQLHEENAALRPENTRLKLGSQLLRDEIARLKNLPPRPPFRTSSMDKATDTKSDNSRADAAITAGLRALEPQRFRVALLSGVESLQAEPFPSARPRVPPTVR